jgi:hypothetical protein
MHTQTTRGFRHVSSRTLTAWPAWRCISAMTCTSTRWSLLGLAFARRPAADRARRSVLERRRHHGSAKRRTGELVLHGKAGANTGHRSDWSD